MTEGLSVLEDPRPILGTTKSVFPIFVFTRSTFSARLKLVFKAPPNKVEDKINFIKFSFN